MNSEFNPYEAPESRAATAPPYVMTAFRPGWGNPSDVLVRELEVKWSQGWRLVTSIGLSSRHPLLVWRHRLEAGTTADGTTADPVPAFRVVRVPGFLECLRTRSFSPWSAGIAEQIAGAVEKWELIAFCPRIGFVLQARTGLEGRSSTAETYSVLHCPPVWWRTLLGSSWIRVLSHTLNERRPADADLVTCLGSDRFLLRHHSSRKQLHGDSDPNSAAGRLSEDLDCEDRHLEYRLALWPQWMQVAVARTPNLCPWLAERAAQGWELLCQYESSALFLFTVPATTPGGSSSIP